MPARRAAVRSVALVITCEHGGNGIPRAYRESFRALRRLLRTHRGYDIGALELARQFARALRSPLFYSKTSRLLVDLNRSEWSPQIFSRATPREAREAVLERYYRPYRSAVESAVRAAVRGGRRVVHLSCHSFTPRLDGIERRADVGLLYDPRRGGEARLCTAWQQALQASALTVRRNYPYRGHADGLTTYLRGKFSAQRYLGIELEVNQKYPKDRSPTWRAVRRALVASFREALAHEGC
jgi:predicted N-formylglutamate amidohydrolase